MIDNKNWWRGAVMYQIYPRSYYEREEIFCAFNLSNTEKTFSIGLFKKITLKGFEFV